MPSQFSYSAARLRRVQKLQFGILSPDEVVSLFAARLAETLLMGAIGTRSTVLPSVCRALAERIHCSTVSWDVTTVDPRTSTLRDRGCAHYYVVRQPIYLVAAFIPTRSS